MLFGLYDFHLVLEPPQLSSGSEFKSTLASPHCGKDSVAEITEFGELRRAADMPSIRPAHKNPVCFIDSASLI